MNTYAVTAAQQAGDYYNARLMEQIPELAQLAYEMYLEDYERDLDRLDRLQGRECGIHRQTKFLNLPHKTTWT